MPVILLTGFGEMMLAKAEMPAGVDLIVSKPITLVALRKAVAAMAESEVDDLSRPG